MSSITDILMFGVLAFIGYEVIIKIGAPKSGGGSAPIGGASPNVSAPGGTIYPAVSHYSIANPAGQNQNITYASSGKAAISHRTDVNGTSNPAQEATVYLAWPSGCTGGGHPELAVKFWGPGHTDSSCCYAYIAAVPQGNSLQLGFGGETSRFKQDAPRSTSLDYNDSEVFNIYSIRSRQGLRV